MQTRNRNTFTTIHTEGALLPVDLLQRISENDKNLEGLNPESYHLAPGEKLNEAINRSWNRLSGLWGSFQAARGRLGSTDAGTTLTRERWLLPLFQELGFGRLSTSKAVEIEGKSYPISHRWQNVPLHLVGCGIEMDKRTPGAAGASRTSPHSLMQEYLNRSDDVQWGVISNGLGLRILRDNATLTRQAYIEFDLESMFDGEIYSDFVLLWLICHQSRFETTEKQTECLLEKWSKSAQESGTRALDDLRRGVEEAIVSFGQGFLQHPLNEELRSRLKNGDLSAQDYYRQLLRLVYRLIFLFAAEDRDLLLLPGAPVEARQRFQNYYSTTRLRALAQRQRGSRHHDRYEALRLVMTLLGSDFGCPELAIPALGGFLFDARSTADLNDAKLDNQALLSAVRSLAFITEGNTRRAVDYRNLGPEELGSVYESLLELHPLLNTDAGTFQLTSAAGNERKTTGSYYTPSSLIQVLLDSALDPVIQDRLKVKQDAVLQEQALLELKVCDPACGSGHFLIAAAHRIAGWLAEVRAGDNEPSPNETRRALRDVIRHCIYGVDINPMAVELCKVNLWLESLEPGKPLSFLDAHIKCGNSLVGVGPRMDLHQLEVPDEAFDPVTGDHKTTSTALKKRNKHEREGQESLFVTINEPREDLDMWLAERTREVESMPEDSAAEVQVKAESYRKVNESVEYRKQKRIADLWTAAFFWKTEEPTSRNLEIIAPTHGQLRRLRDGSQTQMGLVERVDKICQSERFFHWALEFPDVSAQKGFDCILGNPPWEKLTSLEREFFSKIPEISDEKRSDIRKNFIETLRNTNPHLYEEWNEKKYIDDAEKRFLTNSGLFPYTAVGEINLYPLFVEISSNLVKNPNGCCGLIIKTGMLQSPTWSNFAGFLLNNNLIKSALDFRNWKSWFPGIGYHERFTLLTLTTGDNPNITFGYYLDDPREIFDGSKVFSIDKHEALLLNPITKSVPAFESLTDKNIILRIYKTFPILASSEAGWKIRYTAGLHMTSEASKLHDYEELEQKGFELDQLRRFAIGENQYLPLFEGKLIHQYDHRFASFEGTPREHRFGIKPGTYTPSDSQKRDPYYHITPRYWISKSDMEEHISTRGLLGSWFICFRDVTNVMSNFRTCVACISDKAAVNYTAPNVVLEENELLNRGISSLLFVSLMNSIPFDYIVRQKFFGAHLIKSILMQIAVPPISKIVKYKDLILPKALELTYTSIALKDFSYYCGFRIDPFKWEDERRAQLKTELDALYFHIYGLSQHEIEHILDSFPILKKAEINKYGEYRTRRLVLEAWDRLEGVEVGNPDGHPPQDAAAVPPKQETVSLAQPRSESQPAVIQTQLPASAKPNSPVTPPAKEVKEIDPPAGQPTLTDFGLYKCEVCGKMVMGFEKANHEREIHGGKSVEWKKMR